MSLQKLKFKLETAQCELLLAFEKANSLAELAKMIHRDVSVVSRQLQKLADDAPVLEKESGRWRLTPLGRQINQWTKSAINSQDKIFAQNSPLKLLDHSGLSKIDQAALLMVGVQNGFQNAEWGARNQLNAEENIEKILAVWRERAQPIIHVRHASSKADSPLKAGSRGADFLDFASPVGEDVIVEKSVASGFADPALLATLKKKDIKTIVVVGFSGNHCVDATARQGADLGFNVYVVTDAIVSFERVSPGGQLIKADTIHETIMANLNQEFATVIDTETLIGDQSGIPI